MKRKDNYLEDDGGCDLDDLSSKNAGGLNPGHIFQRAKKELALEDRRAPESSQHFIMHNQNKELSISKAIENYRCTHSVSDDEGQEEQGVQLEYKPGWAVTNTFDISVQMLGSPPGLLEKEDRERENKIGVVRAAGLKDLDAVGGEGKEVRWVSDDYSCSAFIGLQPLDQGLVGSGRTKTLSKSEMYRLRVRMESISSPAIPEDLMDCAFDMEGNLIEDENEDEKEKVKENGEDKLIVPCKMETYIPIFGLIKDDLNNIDACQDKDVAGSESLDAGNDSIAESQDEGTAKGQIYSPIPCRQIVRFFWNRLLLIFGNEMLASNSLKNARI
jgi:hypothetical protein